MHLSLLNNTSVLLISVNKQILYKMIRNSSLVISVLAIIRRILWKETYTHLQIREIICTVV